MSPASYRAAPPRVDCFGNLFRATINNFTNVDMKAQTPSLKPIFWLKPGQKPRDYSLLLLLRLLSFLVFFHGTVKFIKRLTVVFVATVSGFLHLVECIINALHRFGLIRGSGIGGRHLGGLLLAIIIVLVLGGFLLHLFDILHFIQVLGGTRINTHLG